MTDKKVYKDTIQQAIEFLGEITATTTQGRTYLRRRAGQIQTRINDLREYANRKPGRVQELVTSLADKQQAALDNKVAALGIEYSHAS